MESLLTVISAELLAAARPMTPTEVARRFKGGRQNVRRVTLVIEALARLGHVDTTDGGQSYLLRRSA
ncbi:MAG: hypothetical protein NW217_14805 [Hyphomicrobiaceae bacterium]|nr:hypothetical protein [Hyphomicrobiaceae bacterium]